MFFINSLNLTTSSLLITLLLQNMIKTIPKIINSKYQCYFSVSRLFVFPGQGTQEKGMLNSFISKPQSINIIKEVSRHLKFDFLEIATVDSNHFINKTEVTQPLLILSHYLHFQLQKQLNTNDYMIGHSLGQYSALVMSQSINLIECMKLVKKRGQLMMKYTTQAHGMLIVKHKQSEFERVLKRVSSLNLQVACYNTQTSIIVAGKSELIEKLKKMLKQQRIGSLLLPVSTAFHCKMLQNMKTEFEQELNKIKFQKPKCNIIRNYDCKVYTNDKDIKEGLLLQLSNPVLFSKCVSKVPRQIQFKEIGHKKWISKFIQQIRSNHKNQQ